MKIRKIFQIVLFLCCVALSASAQNISVASFKMDEMDLTANQRGTIVLDQNGEKCALIKVITTQTGFNFDNGSLGITKIENHTGEVWVYLPAGSRRISISHSQLGQLRDYQFPVDIARARTYIMELTTGQVQTVVTKAVTAQYVLFKVNPKNAVVELDGQIVDLNDGMGTKRMPFGTYSYKVQAARHAMATGTVTVNDPKNKHVVNVDLIPQFSTFTFNAPNNAEIWIDDQKKGNGTCKVELGYGSYLVETRLPGHRSMSSDMTLGKADAATPISLPGPMPIYGSLDVNSNPLEASVFIDDKKVGTTPMFVEECLVGNHKIVLKKSGFKDYTQNVKVGEGQTSTVSAALEKGFSAEGNVFTVNGVSFTMIPVEGGTFSMGATSEMTDPNNNEKPVHSVTLSSYYVGETEVTQELWQAVMGENPSRFKGDQNPVEQVSWDDCQEFISRLNKITGKKFRLPTEAEWEFAARGGNRSRHAQYSGSDNLDKVAWYDGNSSSGTHPVKQKQANELGLYDMSGNVWEWCNDWFGEYNKKAQTNPIGPSSGSYRVRRGGSWINSARNCRCSCRSNYTPDFRYNNLGLRLALSDNQGEEEANPVKAARQSFLGLSVREK